jgi:EAL domain-containing protein (putative c-di-GMP-specific phosphodiesterase class I)
VAGGVETQAQADLMRVAGCDELQGWHFSPAIPAEAITAKLAPALKKRA